jgi:hypothetical protein
VSNPVLRYCQALFTYGEKLMAMLRNFVIGYY